MIIINQQILVNKRRNFLCFVRLTCTYADIMVYYN